MNLDDLTPEERAEMDELLRTDPVMWRPLVGPQSEAAESMADVVGYGGAGGGGKTDLVCGLAVTKHRKAIIFRESGTELVGVNGRLRELIEPIEPNAYNGRDRAWVFTRKTDGVRVEIELGSFPDIGDEKKYRGRDHDLLTFDEAQDMREEQVRFLFGWNRSTVQGQRVRILMTFNPPTTVEGRWIIQFFAPWLDELHPNPAMPGELRWFAMIDGVDIEVPDNRPFVLGPEIPGASAAKRARIYDFDPKQHKPEDILAPTSRTFIPSRIGDNPFLVSTGYMRRLQGLPEPLRSQLLKGDFKAGLKDDAFQVIPTAWVEAAMARWKKPAKLKLMESIGADIAMGGDDEHVIMRRHEGLWFDEPIAHKGNAVPDGATSGGLVVAALRDQAVIHLDLFGVGAHTYGFLMSLNLQVIGVVFGDTTEATDRTGRLRFMNLRSMLWWRMREALDPVNNTGIALPPHRRLLADLCAPKWSIPGQCIKVQSRDEIVKAIGRSPDYGTAAILALCDTPKRAGLVDIITRGSRSRDASAGHDPFAVLRHPQ